jgi:hypothetical protein
MRLAVDIRQLPLVVALVFGWLAGRTSGGNGWLAFIAFTIGVLIALFVIPPAWSWLRRTAAS